MEPDIIIIKAIASNHLASELPKTLDPNRIQVEFFAQGGFNKLYSVSCNGHNTRYIFRVALPLVPYYRIESEAAVLSYIKKTTSIPVARVIAWDSSAANKLGFEWILLEMIDGIALYDVWRKITWESKLKIVGALAPLLGQLRDHRCSQIGSLYIAGREIPPKGEQESNNALPDLNHSTDSPSLTSRSNHERNIDRSEPQSSAVTVAEVAAEVVQEHASPLGTSIEALSITAVSDDHDSHDSQPENFAGEFKGASTEQAPEQNQHIVGPILDPLFYLYRRLYLPADRGPYRTSQEWMTAEINMQRTWAKTGPLIKTLTTCGDFDPYDWDSYCDDEMQEMERLFDEYQDVLPNIFAANEGESPYVIHHHDLSLANILIDPDTYEITGIIDWEMIQVVPEWKSSRFPSFLTQQLDFPEIDDAEPRVPMAAEYDEDGEDYNAVVVERRDRWDNRILREHFDKTMSRTWGEKQVSSYVSDNAKTKQKFEASILGITDNISWARSWLKDYLKDTEVTTEKE